MTNDSESLKRKQEQRYAILRYMYIVEFEEKNNRVDPFRAHLIALSLPYSEQEIESALTYLAGEHLARVVATYMNGTKSYKLTHQGVKEIESSFQKPEEPTEHFPPQIIQNFNGPVGAVQTGTHATANVTQNVGADLSAVLSSLEQLKLQVSELPQKQQEDVSVSIEVLEDELKLQDKNPRRIRAALAGLKGVAQGTVAFSSQVATLAQQLKDLNMF